jgi:hypothetical protein
LLSLQHEVYACGGDGCPHALCFMSDDYKDVLRGHDFLRGGNHVGEDRLAPDFVQDFGML